jgi:hypothetical protein
MRQSGWIVNPGSAMRMRVALLLACLVAALPARAENKIFIIENQPDGYGVDQCLVTGAACGKTIAGAYCQSHAYGTAVSFRKIEHGEITGGTGPEKCRGGTCNDYIAIECTR